MAYDFLQRQLLETMEYLVSQDHIDACVYVTRRGDDGLVFEGSEPPWDIDLSQLKDCEIIICDASSFDGRERWKHTFYPQSGEIFFVDETKGLPDWWDADHKEAFGTPTACLMECAGVGDKATINGLLLAGANPTARNSYALRRAAWFGNKDAVEALLDAGADPAAMNSEALVSAHHRGWVEIAQALAWAGASDLDADAWLKKAQQSSRAPENSKVDDISEMARLLADYAINTAAHQNMVDIVKKGMQPWAAEIFMKDIARRYADEHPKVDAIGLFSKADIEQATQAAFGKWLVAPAARQSSTLKP